MVGKKSDKCIHRQKLGGGGGRRRGKEKYTHTNDGNKQTTKRFMFITLVTGTEIWSHKHFFFIIRKRYITYICDIFASINFLLLSEMFDNPNTFGIERHETHRKTTKVSLALQLNTDTLAA